MEKFLDNIMERLTDTKSLVLSIADVVLVAFLLYVLFAFLKKNGASRLIKYIVVLTVAAIVVTSEMLGLELTGKFFLYFVMIAAIALCTLFPQEFRRVLWRISSPREISEMFSTKYDSSDEELKAAIAGIVRAASNMAKKNVGALIVVAPNLVPEQIIESGTRLDAKLSAPLLESIFITKGPLHDGAVIVRGNRIVSAGCFLPLSQNDTLDKELGTRHRAGLGVSELHNVLTIIVSEETGVISTAMDGKLNRYVDPSMLTETLNQVYGLGTADFEAKKKKRHLK